MAFNIALSGLRAANSDLSITGNNIANASTVGFKRSRAEFSDVYANSVLGGGGNAVGSGVLVSEVAQLFTQGNISYTKNSMDMAINGTGFFVLSDAGSVSYSRSGQFGIDSTGYIVSNDGSRLQGFQADNSGNIPGGAPADLQLQSANLPPRQTTGIDMSVNLDAATLPNVTPFSPSDRRSFQFTQASEVFDSLGIRHTATMYFARDAQPNDWTVYVQVDGRNVGPANSAYSTAQGSPVAVPMSVTAQVHGSAFTTPLNVATGVNDTLSLNVGATQYTLTLTPTTYNTPTDVMNEINAQMGLVGVPAVASVDSSGQLVFQASPLGPQVTSFTGNAAAAVGLSTPTPQYTDDMTLTVGATQYTVNLAPNTYSTPAAALSALNTALTTAGVPATATLDTGNQIVITANNVGDTVAGISGAATTGLGFTDPNYLAAGTPSLAAFNLAFDQKGALDTTLTAPILIDNWNPLDDAGNPTGALGPSAGVAPTDPPTTSNFTLSFTGSTQLGTASSPYASNQDGYAAGRLTGIDVSGTGVIFARYTNGEARALGQVALANFQNPQGLQPIGSTAWAQTSDSGSPVVGAPQTGAFGAVQSGAVEDSNVELSDELVNLIIAQRNFQANAKTIETANAVTQTVINLR